jgi:hypothetical protein
LDLGIQGVVEVGREESSEGEVSNGEAVSDEEALVGVCLDSVLNGGAPFGEETGKEFCVVLCLNILSNWGEGSELVELLSEVAECVDEGVNLVSWASFLGVVSVLVSEESEHSLGLGVEGALVFNGGELSPFEDASCLGLGELLEGVADLGVFDLGVSEELSDWFHSAHSFEVVKLECHLI